MTVEFRDMEVAGTDMCWGQPDWSVLRRGREDLFTVCTNNSAFGRDEKWDSSWIEEIGAKSLFFSSRHGNNNMILWG